MTDEHEKPTPLLHHLLYASLIVGLVAIIALFFTSYPMECSIGYRTVVTGSTQVCIRNEER